MSVERVVVVGASAGGVAALEALVAGLPADFPAAVLVVLHIGSSQKSLLPHILSRAGALPALSVTNGAALRPGHIFVAVADHHLIVDEQHVRVTKGPRENHYRPSIDMLFRSAAYHFGPRAVGVVLSGALSDGSSGLFAIKRLGGIAVIQDPDDASYNSMPLSALKRVDIDYALPAAEIGSLLAGLVQQQPPKVPLGAAHYRQELKADIDVAAAHSASERGIMDFAEPSPYSCPECHGVLFRIKEGKTDRFRCHTGHGYTTAALLDEFGESIEATLWHAVKNLQETSTLLSEAAQQLRENGHEAAAESLRERARHVNERVATLRAITLERAGLDERS